MNCMRSRHAYTFPSIRDGIGYRLYLQRFGERANPCTHKCTHDVTLCVATAERSINWSCTMYHCMTGWPPESGNELAIEVRPGASALQTLGNAHTHAHGVATVALNRRRRNVCLGGTEVYKASPRATCVCPSGPAATPACEQRRLPLLCGPLSCQAHCPTLQGSYHVT